MAPTAAASPAPADRAGVATPKEFLSFRLGGEDYGTLVIEALLRDPAFMALGPGRLAGVTSGLAQQERLQLLARLQSHADRILEPVTNVG